MPPKDILIVVRSAKEQSAFAAARLLGALWSAHVSSLQLVPIQEAGLGAGLGAGLPASAWASVFEATRQQAQAEKRAIAKHMTSITATGDASEVEGSTGALARAVARRAVHADLTIIERPGGAVTMAAFEAALFSSGRPVLVMPPNWSGASIGQRVMIAWSTTPEAARAVADAEPFLRNAKDIRVVAVDASPAYEGDTAAGVEISAHIGRRGLKALLHQPDSFGRATDQALLDEARDCDADLIVMGGYGHSRLRELVLGGVTRALIGEAPMPILISH